VRHERKNRGLRFSFWWAECPVVLGTADWTFPWYHRADYFGYSTEAEPPLSKNCRRNLGVWDIGIYRFLGWNLASVSVNVAENKPLKNCFYLVVIVAFFLRRQTSPATPAVTMATAIPRAINGADDPESEPLSPVAKISPLMS
jgi:hypothetical protein